MVLRVNARLQDRRRHGPLRTAFRSLAIAGLAANCLAFVLVALGCSPKDTPEPSEPSEQGPSASDQLASIQEELWQETVSRSADLRFREGLAIGHLDDLSYGSYQNFVDQSKAWVAQLAALEKEELTHEQWIDARALTWDLEILIEGQQWFWHDSVLTSYLSPLPPLVQLLRSQPLATEEQQNSFLQLLSQVPQFIGQLQETVEGQAERGIFVWGPNYATCVALVRSMRATDAVMSPFAVDPERLGDPPPPEALVASQKFLGQVNEIVGDKINPALDELLGLLEGDYKNSSPLGVGASQLPNGEQYYRYATKRSTTMDITPEVIHERGLALVTEMEAEMANLQRQAGFEGTQESFRAALRSDPKFFPKSPSEVDERLMAAAQSMEAVVDQYFSKRPQAPYGVERLDPSLEASQTYGYYRPPNATKPAGTYFYNGSKLDQRSWLNLRAVSLHELVPGHHFHIARQSENERLSDYRRNTWHGAYTEGWGSYASLLGLEAGVFSEDPYSAYGMYMLEVFLATRLVVDPGMNLLGWSLEDGRSYMREHTLESETQISTESLRYSADMPAQALGYQMGKLKFLELRAKAEEALGEGFDIRSFHEAILENGSLPMAVLEEHIDWWIKQSLPGEG